MSEAYQRGAVLHVVPLVTKQGDRFRVSTYLDGREISTEIVPIDRLVAAVGTATLGIATALADLASVGMLRAQADRIDKRRKR